jgi:hypothetical protein
MLTNGLTQIYLFYEEGLGYVNGTNQFFNKNKNGVFMFLFCTT